MFHHKNPESCVTIFELYVNLPFTKGSAANAVSGVGTVKCTCCSWCY